MRDFYQTGTKYQLRLATRLEIGKLEIAIRLSEGTIVPGSNTVAVLVDSDMLDVIIRDLKKHQQILKEGGN